MNLFIAEADIGGMLLIFMLIVMSMKSIKVERLQRCRKEDDGFCCIRICSRHVIRKQKKYDKKRNGRILFALREQENG